jgi:protein involved in polysaccharide export with SLBB domain
MLAAAGGMTEGAASHILFIPADYTTGREPSGRPAAAPFRFVATNPLPAVARDVNPITIDLQALGRGEHQLYLNVPVRPGDVLLVPSAGQVLVEGWVEKPGSYKITPGLTVLGAVAAAGGSLFAADTSSVKIIQLGTEGKKIVFLVDLDKIKHGESPDVPVQDGDIVEVSSSTPKLIPYTFYRFFSSVLHVGGSLPLF